MPSKMLASSVLSSSLLMVASSVCYQVNAQDLEPRSYSNIPIDMHFIVAGYNRSQGSLSPAPEVPIKDSDLQIDAGLLGYATTFDVAGSSSKFDIIASRVCIAGSAIYQGDYVEGQQCGYSDPTLKFTWNFYGAPALTRQEFAKYQQGLVMGVSMQLSVPVGSYDSDKLINVGANQWVFRPGFGMSYRSGNWFYGVNTTIRLYADNDDFFNDAYLEKDPQYNLQAHLIYNLTPRQWISLSGNYFIGGETVKNGVESDDEQSNSRFGINYSWALNQHHSVKLYANTGVITRIGNDFDSYGAIWMYAF
ncbi:transporter [Shewanella gaetbuli]